MTSFAHSQFCVICAKPEELRQLINIFDALFKRAASSHFADVVYLVANRTRVRVTTCNAMGHMSAAVRTAQVISHSQPYIAIFLGTAASLKPDIVQLGDVVIPPKAVIRVYDKVSEEGQRDYHERVINGDFKEFFFEKNALISDMSTIDCSEDALTAVASLNFDSLPLQAGAMGAVAIGDGRYELRQPKVHDDVHIFSCGMVVDSVSYREFITRTANANLRKAAIVDMESYGFFKAIEAVSKTGVGTNCSGIMIRGISDYAGRKSQTEARPEGWKEISVRNAAIVAGALLKRLAQHAVSSERE